jgi:hypothetical protein
MFLQAARTCPFFNLHWSSFAVVRSCRSLDLSVFQSALVWFALVRFVPLAWTCPVFPRVSTCPVFPRLRTCPFFPMLRTCPIFKFGI